MYKYKELCSEPSASNTDQLATLLSLIEEQTRINAELYYTPREVDRFVIRLEAVVIASKIDEQLILIRSEQQ